MKREHIAIIGAGHMGGALIGGLRNDGHESDHIWAVDLDREKLAQLKKTYAIHTTTDGNEAIIHADVVVLAIKPQVFKQTLLNLLQVIHQRQPLLLSVAAGIRISKIQATIGSEKPYPIVRAMPNIAALIGCGATALYANQQVTNEQHNIAESILRAVGTVVWVNDESLMDTVTALSGSGPAYFFLMMHALQKGAEKLGLPEDAARILTIETALGAAKVAVESNLSFQQLVQKVASPGGTTESALLVLEKDARLYNLLFEALRAAKLRSEELAKDT